MAEERLLLERLDLGGWLHGLVLDWSRPSRGSRWRSGRSGRRSWRRGVGAPNNDQAQTKEGECPPNVFDPPHDVPPSCLSDVAGSRARFKALAVVNTDAQADRWLQHVWLSTLGLGLPMMDCAARHGRPKLGRPLCKPLRNRVEAHQRSGIRGRNWMCYALVLIWPRVRYCVSRTASSDPVRWPWPVRPWPRRRPLPWRRPRPRSWPAWRRRRGRWPAG